MAARKTKKAEEKKEVDMRVANPDMIKAIEEVSKLKSISKESLFTAIEEALKSAYKNNFSKQDGVPASNANVRVELDRTTGAIRLYARKTVNRYVIDEAEEISLEEARKISPNYEDNDIVEVEVTPANFRRIAAQTARQSIMNKIRDAEHGKIYDDYIEKESEILTAIIHSTDPETGSVFVELGKTEGILEVAQQMTGDVYTPGERFKVYVLEVVTGRQQARGTGHRAPQVSVSRIHPGLVKRLFEMEVPEIQSGIVQIKSLAREAGARTKMAVYSSDATIDPVGSCVGPHGQRVEHVVGELRGEKIDIIRWSADPAEFIANALNPANVVSVTVNEGEKSCRVIVPDNQLSLAIGKEGQNARLAAKLTGWKIDIKSQSQEAELEVEAAAQTEETELPETEA